MYILNNGLEAWWIFFLTGCSCDLGWWCCCYTAFNYWYAFIFKSSNRWVLLSVSAANRLPSCLGPGDSMGDCY